MFVCCFFLRLGGVAISSCLCYMYSQVWEGYVYAWLVQDTCMYTLLIN